MIEGTSLMSLPKSSILAELDKDNSPGYYDKVSAAVANSSDVLKSSDGLSLPELKVYNDFVAVLLIPRKTSIVVTGTGEYANIGIIVGAGQTCVNKFKISTPVLINSKAWAAPVAVIEDLPPEYTVDGETRRVVLIQERNIFCEASIEDDIYVVDAEGVKHLRGQ